MIDMCDGSKTYEVVALRASEDGDRVFVRVRELGAPKGRGSKTFSLRVEEYAALPFEAKQGMRLSVDDLAHLESAAASSDAYGRGLNILGYGANSAKSLQRKLVQKGYDADAVRRAVDTLSERGYLQEERDAVRAAQQMVRRGRGMRRVLQELRAKGYGEQALAAVRDAISDEDFVELCAQAARGKMRYRPTDRAEYEKLAAYLMRCGFSSTEIREALRMAWDDDAQNV